MNDKLENYKGIKNFIEIGNQIKNKIKDYLEKIERKSEFNIDKYEMGFNKDNRFSSAKIEVSVDAYTGTFGNSGVSIVTIVKDSKVFKDFFIKVLNKHFNELMIETADEIIDSAKTKNLEAIKELEDMLKTLKLETKEPKS
ncbi:hypothetical protein A2300_03965 [Candidatus Falkowbacteria bacterium RIFOXYB2_FULL_35_7]|uniref:Uncharacterized protein n=1 Tax=Candidatus Falkowbacteria bacterium RIFOXYC2_FULL_36_12 TaxID=1798002 RepID=A0A1F5T1J5_9BACT|nr:MAG: hypothetical protein A2300_03965 [Candidatus Falkowbacteria bacterium RIFOXYB2_FULL_35_7]OGF32596.1 MAG: hypothetical protein A2478_00035 [Candidatus Falkowbacteria bacterium RIFOXYC2_FULL_36_12]